MIRQLTMLLVLVAGCAGPSTPKYNAPDQGHHSDSDEPSAPVELLDWYDGTATQADGTELSVDVRFVTAGDGRALMRVGPFEPAWGYSAEFRVEDGQVLVETGSPQGPVGEDWGAISMAGVADGDEIAFEVEIADGGELPFVSLRMVPHDGVKPVLNPVVDFDYDPAPVAGVYVGSVFALGVMNGSCTLELDADPLRVAAFDCNEVDLGNDPIVLWDEERSLLNVASAGAESMMLVAELSAPHDGELSGVLASLPRTEVVVAPGEVPFEALVGLVTLNEDGLR